MSKSSKKRSILYVLIILAVVGVIPLSKYVYIEYQKYSITKRWQDEVVLFERGIKRDIPLAIYGLAYAYHTGHGVGKDLKKARELYKQAADRGEMLAQYNLGFMYHNGEGGKQDIDKAIFYYQQAAEQDYDIALMKLSLLYQAGDGVEKDLDKAKELEKRALANFGKSISYNNQYRQIIKYQLGEF